MRNIFREHPNDVGETYFQHFLTSCIFGFKLMLIAGQAFIHAILPWYFKYNTSENISKLNTVLQSRKKSTNLNKN